MKTLKRKILEYILPLPLVDFLSNLKNKKLKFKGRELVDKKLSNYLNKRNGFYIELGANDGISESNTYFLENYKAWKGILIEPIIHNFLLCKKNRSKRNKFFCNACVPFGYKRKYVDLVYANLMTYSTNLKSELKNLNNHFKQSEKFNKLGEKILFGAPAITLTKILDRSKAPNNIDFLSLDTEGTELEVLKGVNFKRYSFNYILIETRNIQKVKSFLRKNNYHYIEKLTEIDFLFSKIKKIKNKK